jgi:hypothetical protein
MLKDLRGVFRLLKGPAQHITTSVHALVIYMLHKILATLYHMSSSTLGGK